MIIFTPRSCAEFGTPDANEHVRAFMDFEAEDKYAGAKRIQRVAMGNRAHVAHAARMARRAPSGAAAGLVSVSTTCRGGLSYLQVGIRPQDSIDRDSYFLENSITIDPKEARVTRLRKGIGVGCQVPA